MSRDLEDIQLSAREHRLVQELTDAILDGHLLKERDEESNRRRAKLVMAALQVATDYPDVDLKTALGDFMANMLHFDDYSGSLPSDYFPEGRRHYEAEKTGGT